MWELQKTAIQQQRERLASANSQYFGEDGEAGEVGEYFGDEGDICTGAVRGC